MRIDGGATMGKLVVVLNGEVVDNVMSVMCSDCNDEVRVVKDDMSMITLKKSESDIVVVIN